MKTINLPFNKVMNPVSYKMIEKMRSFDTFHCTESNSQLSKRLDFEEAEEIIEFLNTGNDINLI